VDVSFGTPSLQRHCNEEAALVARWGPRGAASLCRTLQELAALDDLAEIAALPYIRLTVDPSGAMVLASSDGSQITLEAGDDAASRGALGEIRAVVVLGVSVVQERRRSNG
jgi:hypothetical protein